MTIDPLLLMKVVIAFLLGAFVGAVAMYVKNRLAHPDEHFLGRLIVEQKVYTTSEGLLFKDKILHVNERLLYKSFPLTGWVEKRVILDQTIDLEPVKPIVEIFAALGALPQVPRIVRRALPEK